MPEFHDRFRQTKHSFRKAMETYDALAELQEEDGRLQIHAISTATADNMAKRAHDREIDFVAPEVDVGHLQLPGERAGKLLLGDEAVFHQHASEQAPAAYLLR